MTEYLVPGGGIYAADDDTQRLMPGSGIVSLLAGGGITLIVQGSSHALSDDGPMALTQAHQLTIQETAHALSDDGPMALTQAHQLTIQEALHAHAVENTDLEGGGLLVIQETAHALSDDGPMALTQAHQLTVQEVTHLHSVDNIDLLVDGGLLPSNCRVFWVKATDRIFDIH